MRRAGQFGGAGGAATANASAANGGSAIAQALAGSGSVLEARPPQTLAQLMEDRQLRLRLAAQPASVWVDRQTQPRHLLRCWAAPQTRTQQRRGGVALPSSAGCSKRQLLRYDDQWQCGPGEVHCRWRKRAGPGNRTDQFRKFPIGSIYVHKPPSPSSHLTRTRPVQSHRPVVSFLLPTRSLQGRVFRSLVDQALVL